MLNIEIEPVIFDKSKWTWAILNTSSSLNFLDFFHGSDFLRGNFSNREDISPPLHFRWGTKTWHLKKYFFKQRPICFHINSTRVIRTIKWNKASFPYTEINMPLMSQSTVSRRLDSISEANSSSNWVELEWERESSPRLSPIFS